MSVIRYTVRQVGRHAAAFMPMAPLTPDASSRGIIRTDATLQNRQPSPKPPVVNATRNGPDRATQESNVAPDWWMPVTYLTDIRSVMNPQDARFSWMPPFTVIPPRTGDVVRVPEDVFRPYPGLPQGTTMTWPRTISNRFASITQPGVYA